MNAGRRGLSTSSLCGAFRKSSTVSKKLSFRETEQMLSLYLKNLATHLETGALFRKPTAVCIYAVSSLRNDKGYVRLCISPPGSFESMYATCADSSELVLPK